MMWQFRALPNDTLKIFCNTPSFHPSLSFDALRYQITWRFDGILILWQTAEGLKQAVNKQDLAICGTDVVLEPASSLNAYNTVFNEESIADLGFPIAFLKNPSRTVVVKELPEDLSFHYLKGALSSWGHVSSFGLVPHLPMLMCSSRWLIFNTSISLNLMSFASCDAFFIELLFCMHLCVETGRERKYIQTY